MVAAQGDEGVVLHAGFHAFGDRAPAQRVSQPDHAGDQGGGGGIAAESGDEGAVDVDLVEEDLDRVTSRVRSSIPLALASAGRVNRKVAPVPGCDSTQMRPPWCSTTFLQIARPIPVPG